MGHFGCAVVALVIDRSALARRQLQEPAGLEFEQERAAGHVFGSTGVDVPAPPGAEFAGESRPMPRRMFNEQCPDLDERFGPQAAAPDDGLGRHPGRGYAQMPLTKHNLLRERLDPTDVGCYEGWDGKGR